MCIRDSLYVIADIGKLKIELHAAEALLRKAGQVLDQVSTLASATAIEARAADSAVSGAALT